MADANAGNNGRIQIPSPPNFKGGKDKANMWIVMMENWFEMPGIPQNMTDIDKIHATLFKMTDGAAGW